MHSSSHSVPRGSSPSPNPSSAPVSTADAPQPWVRLAHLLRPQGRHGELLAEILTDFPESFATRTAVFLAAPAPGNRPQPATVERHWLHKGRLVLKFLGVDSISAAELLRGHDVVIPREQRMSLQDGSVYIDDLIGCTVFDAAQMDTPALGVVRAVEPQPETADLLVLEDAAGREHLIPFAQAYIVRAEVEARRITLRLPAGLLEINAPPTAEERAARDS